MNITEKLAAAKHELEQRMGCELTTLSTDSGWCIYKEESVGTLKIISGPLPKKELIQWVSEACYGLVSRKSEVAL